MRASVMMADAIARRDVDTIATLLAPGFMHRSPGARFVDGFVRDNGTWKFRVAVDLPAPIEAADA